jgi:predicted lipoprotein with Yx(FWY)xxD motif
MRTHGWAVAGLGSLVLLLAACGTSSTNPGSAYGGSSPMSTPSSGSPAYGSGSGASGSGTSGGPAATLTIKRTKIGDVLANAKGYTLYWYAKDHKNGAPTCSGQCLSAWPALIGRPTAAMGVTLAGKLGTITRPGGTVQATYNGYPLYTYAEDMSPGETSGNGEGGVWHVITGKVLTTAKTATGSGSSGSGSSGSGSSGSGSSGSGSGGYGGSGYGSGSSW